MMSNPASQFVRAASLAEVRSVGCLALQLDGYTVALFAHDDRVYAVDNRCPHMGFPLEQGTLQDGILTCHWHHARFDLESGGTFDQWADDVRRFPVEVRDGDVWVNITPEEDPCLHQCGRLLVGLERDIPLVIGKAVLQLAAGDREMAEPIRTGLEFGAAFRWSGWGQGLTILTCLMNIVPHLEDKDHPRALYHGLAAVSREVSGSSPRFGVAPLPEVTTDISTLKRWFRRFIEVRDAEGAERCLVSAIAAGADDRQVADMLFAAATDHRYLQVGHVLDFTNKALEALDIAGWELAGTLLTSLVRSYATASRMEESNAWRNPVDLVNILEDAFVHLPDVLERGRMQAENNIIPWPGRKSLVNVILDDDPHASVEAMMLALVEGATEVELASAVSYAAALRIARFHTSNEFSDWDTALHTFTFANAVEQGLRRAPSTELLRGVFDAAMSVFLDRFLNIPAARLPQLGDGAVDSKTLFELLPALLDRQQQVNQAGDLVAQYLFGGGDQDRIMAELGKLLLREDRDFHTIQTLEVAFRQSQLLQGEERIHVIIAATRYLAAHTPTVRAQGQTYEIAYRLHRGDRLHI
jgi:nitrite reductase/ring-hydroxylating ferredoxin subunit